MAEVISSCRAKISVKSPSNRSAHKWVLVVPLINCAVTRTRLPAFLTLPSTI